MKAKIIFIFLALALITSLFFINKQDKASINKNSLFDDAICKGCNVILISVDSLRADRMSTFGYKRETTPNFDKFSQKSALFLNYFSSSFLTPVSEAAVQTGMYPSSNGITNFDTPISNNVDTISQYFKSYGYKTTALLSSPEFEFYPILKKSFSKGFDEYEYLNLNFSSTGESRNYPSIEILNKKIDNSLTKKSFIWIAVGGVHWPFGENSENMYADPEYNGYFKEKTLEWSAFSNIYNNIIYPDQKNLSQADIQYVNDQYDNGVKGFDDFFGNLISLLEKKNMLSNTIIVLESEHGEDLGEHGYFAHYDIFSTQTHTPLLVYIPQIQKEQRIQSLTTSIDVLPTILELTGIKIPSIIQGKSLFSIINEKEEDGKRKQIFLERNPLWEEAPKNLRDWLKEKGIEVQSGIHKDIAIRTTNWLYISRLSSKRLSEISWWQEISGKKINFPEEELYDLKNDPQETKNVINRYPETAKILREELNKWHKKSSSGSAKTETDEILQPYF